MQLYPKAKVFNSFNLKVSELHTIFVEESGNKNGKPVIFLHGGPGAGCNSKHASFFDPTRYHITLLDQRGSGRSTPRGEIYNNTLANLVNDCETLRKVLNVSKWHVVLGGSWGFNISNSIF